MGLARPAAHFETEADPPPELVLGELEPEADPEVDGLLVPPPEAELPTGVPLVCEPLLASLLPDVEAVELVLGDVGVRHGISADAATGSPLAAGVAAEVSAAALAGLATAGVEQLSGFDVVSDPSGTPDGEVGLAVLWDGRVGVEVRLTGA